MPSDTGSTHSTTTDLKHDMAVARPDVGHDATLATPQDHLPAPRPQEPLQTAKESYADYVKKLPPPFWETSKTPPRTKTDKDEAVAAQVNAVCAPVTAAQREQDKRLQAMSWRERWRHRTATREARKKNKDVDLRPVERGSRAQLNVFGVNTQEKRGKKR
ncbi:hypothetical protein ACEQ8H_005645 [Pleosporales sp. CAS-2024a]